jgi:formylglycine-generating enzyme required for sulfatase activity
LVTKLTIKDTFVRFYRVRIYNTVCAFCTCVCIQINVVITDLGFVLKYVLSLKFISRDGQYKILVFSGVLLTSLSFYSAPHAYANNLAIENVELVDQDTEADTIEIQFDISWNNAYADLTGTDAVLDAVWVVVKISGSDEHLTLDVSGLNPAGFQRGDKQSGSAFALLDIVVTEDRKGAFIQPGDEQSAAGTMDFHDVSLKWSYVEDGYSDSNADDQSVEVLGFEMVYVHEGSFEIGDVTNAVASFMSGYPSGKVNETVDSEDMISFRNNSTASNYWYYQSGSNTNEDASGTAFDLPGEFPKGYKGFYIMKTEISEGLYTDFYNNLTTNQKASRVAGSSAGQYKAVNNINWWDLAAFCDFFALRPMTEMEYEKAARGKASRVANEYAWGSTSITACSGLTNGGATSEVCSGPAGANTNWDGVMGNAARVGMFATASSTREQAGASYYGVLDLTGNVWEMVVSVGHSTGRLFQGTHGDGRVSTASSYEGNATNSDWPGWDFLNPTRGLDDVNTLRGVGMKGGGAETYTEANGEISDREEAANWSRLNSYDGMDFEVGGRCVRTAPQIMVDYFESEKS